MKPLTAYASSSRLAADLGRACVDKEDADVSLVARDGSSFLAHKVVIACRSAVLEGLLGDAIMDAAPRPNASAAKKGASGDSKHVASHKSSLGGDASILAGGERMGAIQRRASSLVGCWHRVNHWHVGIKGCQPMRGKSVEV